MLTDKTRDAFNEWYYQLIESYDKSIGFYYDMDYFTDSMKYGIYVDFFDSVGINIIVKWANNYDNIHYYEVWVRSKGWLSNHYVKRSEAREQAIKEANNIFNNRP